MNFTKKALRSLYAADWTNGFEYENMLLGIEIEEDEFMSEYSNKDSENNRNGAGGKGKIILPWILFGVTAIGFIIFASLQGGNQSNVSVGSVGEEAVATVDGESITANDLYQLMVSVIGSQAVEQLITEKLIDNEAAKQNIAVSEDEINAEFEEIKSNFPDEATFNMQLQYMGITPEQFKDQLASEMKLRKLVEPEIEVTDEEIQQYYDNNQSQFGTPEQVRASHILVKKEDKELAEKILAEVKNGGDFAELAKEYSEDGSAAQGGDLGFFGRGQMVAPFEEAAFSLDVNEISDLVESQFGYHIIKVTDKQEAEVTPFEEVKEDIREMVFNQKVSERISTYIQELRSAAKIENALAKEAEA